MKELLYTNPTITIMGTPLFDWMDGRSSGVLLHPTSLPNQYAVGSFGPSAKAFIDILSSCGFSYWQLLPLGPTGYGDSPYQSYSSHAINPMLMDLDSLLQYGWVSSEDLVALRPLSQCSTVNFNSIRFDHETVRRKAVAQGLQESSMKAAYLDFLKKHNSWIEDYALFMALKKEHNGTSWNEWNKQFRDYETAKSADLPAAILEEVEFIQFEQFLLMRQWMELKAYANQRGIDVIGDIPIYVSPDSVDVWANKALFQVSKLGKFTHLAGVPPDYFNENGQFWGNPLYDWKQLKNTDYRWWIDRLRHTLSLYDVVRFDHFRALSAYWSIPANATSAKEGKWVKGPGIDFFHAIKRDLPHAKLILEDLGEITTDVIELRDATGCPGLAVLQFAFGGGADNFYLPHNVDSNTVVYTGTHDNDTSQGWYHHGSEHEKDHFRRYFRVSGNEAGWDMIRAAYASTAKMCIIPMQDLLGLGSDARMNTPGEALGNWAWRMNHRQQIGLSQYSAEYLRSLKELYGR